MNKNEKQPTLIIIIHVNCLAYMYIVILLHLQPILAELYTVNSLYCKHPWDGPQVSVLNSATPQ